MNKIEAILQSVKVSAESLIGNELICCDIIKDEDYDVVKNQIIKNINNSFSKLKESKQDSDVKYYLISLSMNLLVYLAMMNAKDESELSGEYGQFINDTINELTETYKQKNKAYGNSFDLSLEEFGIVAAFVRLSDKINRFNSLIDNPSIDKGDEALDDTIKDSILYCAMTIRFLK